MFRAVPIIYKFKQQLGRLQYKCGSHKSYFVPESKKNLNLSQLFLTLDKRSTYISDEPTKSIFCLLKSGNYYKDLMYTISE